MRSGANTNCRLRSPACPQVSSWSLSTRWGGGHKLRNHPPELSVFEDPLGHGHGTPWLAPMAGSLKVNHLQKRFVPFHRCVQSSLGILVSNPSTLRKPYNLQYVIGYVPKSIRNDLDSAAAVTPFPQHPRPRQSRFAHPRPARRSARAQGPGPSEIVSTLRVGRSGLLRPSHGESNML